MNDFAPADVSTETTAPSAPVSDVSTDSSVAGAGVVEGSGYSPNYKFRVHDQEHEFDEYLRPVIKDKDTEEKIRALYAKAYGLDVVKPKYEKKRAEFDDLNSKHSAMMTDLQALSQASKTDLRKFFSMTGIPQEQLYKYVLDEIKFRELPEEHQQAVMEKRRIAEEKEALLAEKAGLESQLQRGKAERHQAELDSVFADHEVTQFSSEFDKRAGRAGAFKEAVERLGSVTYHETGKYMSPTEAVQNVYRQYAPLMGFSFNNQTQNQQEISPASPPAAAAKPPTIPNVGGGGSAASGKKVFKSLDDLRKYAATL